MKYKDFTEFPVWKKSFQLLLKIYRLTKSFPSEEKFGMVSDIRRSANSIPHNIAEGFGREGTKDKCQFYKISRGSAYELFSQALASHALDYIAESDKNEITDECKAIIEELNNIIHYLNNK